MDMNVSCTIFCAAAAATCNIIRYSTEVVFPAGLESAGKDNCMFFFINFRFCYNINLFYVNLDLDKIKNQNTNNTIYYKKYQQERKRRETHMCFNTTATLSLPEILFSLVLHVK